MKKYTPVLFVFSLFIILLGFNVNSVKAMGNPQLDGDAGFAPGCTKGDNFSRTTGKPCGTTMVVTCPTGDLFSSVTGQPCTAWQDNFALNTLFNRELAVGSKGDDVKALQQILKDAGFLSGKVDGSYGPITKGAVIKYQTNNSLTATGTVDANTLQEIKLIPWYKMCPLINSAYGVSYTCPPIPTNPQPPVVSSITVLSPNGGETWQKGTTQTIQWQDNGTSNCQVGSTCASPAYDIQLIRYSPPCAAGYACPMYMIAPYTIGKGVSGSSYSWSVGQVIPTACPTWGCDSSTVTAPDGSYTVQVCQSGTSVCDSSDSYFNIYSAGSSTNLTPVIDGVTAPTSLAVGQTGTWTVQAHDPENGSLTYYSDWGDSVSGGTVNNSYAQNNQTSTFTHSYSSAGNYTVVFTVRDNAGLTAQTSSTVQVGNVVIPSSITVLSPNGGETWQKGTTQTIQWQDNTPRPVCSYPMTCMPAPMLYDIKLFPYQTLCTTTICPMIMRAPYTIATGVVGQLFNWTVGKGVNNIATPDGVFTIQVCQSGTSTCDLSDNYFTITAPANTVTLSSGNNYYFKLSSANMTLDSLNLRQTAGFVGGANPASTDQLMFVKPDGTTVTYFYATTAGYQGWYDFAANPTTLTLNEFLMIKKINTPMTWVYPTGTVFYGSDSAANTNWYNDFKAKYQTSSNITQ